MKKFIFSLFALIATALSVNAQEATLFDLTKVDEATITTNTEKEVVWQSESAKMTLSKGDCLYFPANNYIGVKGESHFYTNQKLTIARTTKTELVTITITTTSLEHAKALAEMEWVNATAKAAGAYVMVTPASLGKSQKVISTVLTSDVFVKKVVVSTREVSETPSSTPDDIASKFEVVIPTNDMKGWAADKEVNFHVNTWSGEIDGSNMLTPFIEYWQAKENGGLADATFTYTAENLTNLPTGWYKLTGKVRALAELGGVEPAGVSVFANAKTESIIDGALECVNGVFKDFALLVQVKDGKLEVGVKVANANVNWVSWKNFKVEYLGSDIKNPEIFTDLFAEVPSTPFNAEIAEKIDSYNGRTPNETRVKELAALIEQAKTSASFYAGAQENLDKANAILGDVVAKTNVYNASDLDKVQAELAKYAADLADGTLDNLGAMAIAPWTTNWHGANVIDDVILPLWTIGGVKANEYDAPLYINTWSVEGNTDGSDFKVPFFEYWTGDDNSLGENTIAATIKGLYAGTYEVQAWVRVRQKNNGEGAPYGITLQLNDGKAVEVAGEQIGTSQMYLQTVTASGKVGPDGKLVIKFNVAADNNISWLSFKDVMYTQLSFDKPEATPIAIDFSEIGENGAYFYNKEAGVYLTKGNDWGTRLSYTTNLNDALKAKLVAVDGAETYTLETWFNNKWNQTDIDGNGGAGIWVDGNGRGGYDGCYEWTVTENADGTFTFGNKTRAGLISVTSAADGRLYFSDEEGAQSVWQAYDFDLERYKENYDLWYKSTMEEGQEITEIAPAAWREFSSAVPSWGGKAGYPELYNGGGSVGEGTVMSNTISGLKPGVYTVTMELYASSTGSRDGFECPLGDGISVAFANNATANVPVVDRLDISRDTKETYSVTCYVEEDGTLTYGLKNLSNSGNWYVGKLVSITCDQFFIDPFDIELSMVNVELFPESALQWQTITDAPVAKINQGDVLPCEKEVVDGKSVYAVHATAKVAEAWDNQFWICSAQTLNAGDKIKVSFRYKAAKAASVGTQAHAEPGNYNHWACIGNVSFTTDWQTFSTEVDVTSSHAGSNGMQSIAFNLNDFADANDYYFDDIKVMLYKEVANEDPELVTIDNVLNNSDCEGDDFANFVARILGVGDGAPAVVEGKEGKGIMVAATAKAADAWDNQFFIDSPRSWEAGDEITIKFDYKADAPAKASTQCHGAPGAYIHWAAIGDINFTTEWQHFETTIKVPNECKGRGFHSIAFNLNEYAEANNYYFDNITWGGSYVVIPEPKAAFIESAPVTISVARDYSVAVKGLNIADAAAAVNGKLNRETNQVELPAQSTSAGFFTGATLNLSSDYTNGTIESDINYYSGSSLALRVNAVGGTTAANPIVLINEGASVYTIDIAMELEADAWYHGRRDFKFDAARVAQLLGVESLEGVTTKIVNTTTGEYVDNTTDGWRNADGDACQWGDMNSGKQPWGVYVKLVDPASGTFSEVGGAGQPDGQVCVAKWALISGAKTVILNCVVTFVTPPAPEITNIADCEIAQTITVNVVEKANTQYSAQTSAFDVAAVCAALGIADIAEADQFIVNVTDGALVKNSTDGWRNVEGDAATWGTGAGMVCVKIDDPASGSINYIGCIDETHDAGDTYTAKWAFVVGNKAVVVDVVLTFTADGASAEDANGIDMIAAESAKTIYDLNGRKVVAPVKGNIYIVNGKKMLVK